MDRDGLADRIGQICVEALTAEVSATPKPGLVDRANSGAHRDMDYNTFLVSIAAIAPAFSQFARAGMAMERLDAGSLAIIRPLGVACEQAMFTATHGVNTHKGAIFSLGIVAAAAGYCAVAQGGAGTLEADAVCDAAAAIAQGAQADFDHPLPAGEPMTKGRELYARYGMRGIRGEAGDGFPSVRALLPELRRLTSRGEHTQNSICLQTLLGLMATVDDTNVAARCGAVEAVLLLHTEARKILAVGGALTPQGMALLQELDRDFIAKNISPGGCADLLSVAVTLLELEQLEEYIDV